MSATRFFIATIIIGGLFLVNGCQSLNDRIRAYDGPPLATNQITLLRIQKENLVMLTVDKIDNKNQPRWTATEIELLPGKHELEVFYRDLNVYRSATNWQIGFVAEPSHIYELHASQIERSFGKQLGQEYLFQRGCATCWIIDNNTKKIVAGVARKAPLRWYE